MPKVTRGKRQTRYVSRLAVWAPSAHAVVDMLRYDTCYPATEVEAGRLCAMIKNPNASGIVRLTMAAASDRTPSYGRWTSLGCVVLATWGADDPGPSDSELDGLRVLHAASE